MASGMLFNTIKKAALPRLLPMVFSSPNGQKSGRTEKQDFTTEYRPTAWEYRV